MKNLSTIACLFSLAGCAADTGQVPPLFATCDPYDLPGELRTSAELAEPRCVDAESSDRYADPRQYGDYIAVCTDGVGNVSRATCGSSLIRDHEVLCDDDTLPFTDCIHISEFPLLPR
jgi:hypothetical protein